MFPVFETVVVTDCEVTTVSALSERLQAVIKSIYDIQTAESNIKFVEKKRFFLFFMFTIPM